MSDVAYCRSDGKKYYGILTGKKFGSFEWLTYGLPEESETEQEEAAE